MFRNQYLMVTGLSASGREFAGMTPVTVMGFNVYHDSNLNLSSATHESVEICLLGYIIDPTHPERTNEDIIEDLAQNCKTQSSLFEAIQILSGRYVLVYKSESAFIALGDACNLRQMYFGQLDNLFVMTSSEVMFLNYFDLPLKTSALKNQHLSDPSFVKRQHAWFGDKGVDDRLFKVLPNHYLDLNTQTVNRIPYIAAAENLSEEDIICFASDVLKGTFSALLNRGLKLKLALTAGLDSRLLLAASKDFKDKIDYYRFNHDVDSSDTVIPGRLAKYLNLDYEGISPKSLDDQFLSEYKKEHLHPTILPKTTHIQYYYYHWHDPKILSINGGATEIARCTYGFTRKEVTLDMLIVFSRYAPNPNNEFMRSELSAWLKDAQNYSEQYQIPLLDLFYWEQRMGNWAANLTFAKDIAIEEICPCNNRSLIAHFLRVHPSKRLPPNYAFFYKLIERLWAETLTEPINPEASWLKGMLRRDSALSFATKTSLQKTKNVLLPRLLKR